MLEIEEVFDRLKSFDINNEVELDLTLARGLNYYTGAIFEVKSEEVKIGSICGGGRYDDLTGIFGMPDVSGVGISFGADRIYDVLLSLDRFPASTEENTELMFVNFGDVEAKYILPLLGKLRNEGIRAELYPDKAKMKKQMTYANSLKVPYVALIGENEMNENKITLKSMESGEQKSLTFDEIISLLKA